MNWFIAVRRHMFVRSVVNNLLIMGNWRGMKWSIVVKRCTSATSAVSHLHRLVAGNNRNSFIVRKQSIVKIGLTSESYVVCLFQKLVTWSNINWFILVKSHTPVNSVVNPLLKPVTWSDMNWFIVRKRCITYFFLVMQH